MVLPALLLVLAACGEAPPQARDDDAPVTVASLVPAATDLLIGMGAADHLVAVSNYDLARAETADLPRVGDYQTTDWERLAALRPGVMIVQLAPDRVPAGMVQRAERLDITLINVRIDRLEDIFTTIELLGEAIEQPHKASSLREQLQIQLNAVRQRVEGRPAVRALIVTDEGGRHIAGPDNFLDDLLHAAGGTNAAARFDKPWPSIDREMMAELAPQAVLQLMPGASPQVLERAERFWASMPDLPAVRDGRVYILNDWWVLQPGSRVGDLAERMVEKLHPGDGVGPDD